MVSVLINVYYYTIPIKKIQYFIQKIERNYLKYFFKRILYQTTVDTEIYE